MSNSGRLRFYRINAALRSFELAVVNIAFKQFKPKEDWPKLEKEYEEAYDLLMAAIEATVDGKTERQKEGKLTKEQRELKKAFEEPVREWKELNQFSRERKSTLAEKLMGIEDEP